MTTPTEKAIAALAQYYGQMPSDDYELIRSALEAPHDDEVKARVTAARKRLGDAKAIHSLWSEMPKYEGDHFAIDNMNNIEQIIYSAICYLDGVDGPNLTEARALTHPAPVIAGLEEAIADALHVFDVAIPANADNGNKFILPKDEAMKIYATLRAYAQGRKQSAVPGWKLVPIEPTKDMLKAAGTYHGGAVTQGRMARMWALMLSVTPPTPPVTGSAQGWRNDEPPMDGTAIYSRYMVPMRFLPYKPASSQFKSGIKGRWQSMNDYGGWENCQYSPTDWMTHADYNAHLQSQKQAGGE